MSTYEQNQLIDDVQKNLRSALITYTKGDMASYSHFMYELSGTVSNQWYHEYTRNVAMTEVYTDTPPYYLDALTALQVFSHGYYQVARVAAQRSIDADVNYILPRQIHGYASVMLGDWQQAIVDMQRLRDKDTDYEQLYTFLA